MKIQPRFRKVQPCHLSTAQDNNILFNQSEEPITSDQQVSNECNIMNSNGQTKSKMVKKFDLFRPKSSKNTNGDEVQKGGGAFIRAQNQEA